MTVYINCGSNRDQWGDYRFDPQDPTAINKAVWTEDGHLDFIGDADSATLLSQDRVNDGDPMWMHRFGMDENVKQRVECIDFSKFLEQFRGQEVYVKLDIEGAEYDVLEKVIADGNLDIVKEWYIEWHDHFLFPQYKDRGDALRRSIQWRDWDSYMVIEEVNARWRRDRGLPVPDQIGWAIR